MNYCSFNLTITSPNNQTSYDKTLPLNFNLTWTNYPEFLLPMPLNGYYAYSIDGSPFVRIEPVPSPSDHIVGSSEVNFLVNPSFSNSVNISNLEEGYHNLVINASLYHYNNYPPTHFYFNITTSPYVFFVGEQTQQTASPAPSFAPSFSAETQNSSLTLAVVAVVVAFCVITAAMLLYRRQRKTYVEMLKSKGNN
ncbi:MAG: hypothetical protein M1540_01900 [Candidatus Bathyarchaeota archaeon]|nr:hypothetical protein [Candidatus Bathyarchaeota archaeon]